MAPRGLPKANSSDPGVTLVEVIISAAILSAILAALFGFMSTYVDAVSYSERTSTLLNTTTRAIERLASVLAGAGVTLTREGKDLLYQEPVGPIVQDLNGDGHLDVVWGARYGSSELIGGAKVVRFVATAQFSEAARNIDLNGDGDTSDVFDMGHLEELVYASLDTTDQPLGPSIAITPDTVLQLSGDEGGDLNGDGVADPIFSFLGPSRLRLHIFASDLASGRPAFIEVSTVVEIRNVR